MLKKIMHKTINNLGYDLVKPDKRVVSDGLPADFDKETLDTYHKVKPYTMTTPERIASLVNAVNYLVKNNIEGDFVECGVWRGGSTMAAIDTLVKTGDKNREIYLYDTYEGMSEPTEHDKVFTGTAADELMNTSDKNDPTSVWCYSALEEVQKNVGTLNYPAGKVHYVKGKVEDSIPQTLPGKIALLRLDTDWYESTAHELKHLYPLLVPGGVIIIDDYGHWEGARKAVDEYIAENKLPLLLNRIDYTGRIGVKY
ncbi:TylF/MycF/NovP-related O-methyltransferase [Mucilaginibacter sabulilitoris]|uniref:TylF/MycF/NovP-related O-methyltransferase n=1 Tax=Mucilaginibacter sabulilitoris TaxID=1173583 RepID=A0ABZ0TKH9_9SPHI|nr:TylF/MycF/NovP-related O-methyltransferase [Mucilaginibacter sabulilitoris]WPU93553.1 TylF/MycF/NovP-related O-methyltransferase [Mucilaginibacter sabulilitoris]